MTSTGPNCTTASQQATEPAVGAPRPITKVLFISADQWRGEALSCLGHPAAQTPHLDALAADATLFTNHFSCAAPCGPARTTFLTGLYPFIHRSVRNGTPLAARHTNLALEARKAGYDPVLFGYTDSSTDPATVAPADPRLRSFEGVLPGFRLEASLNEGCLTGWLSELARKGYDIPPDDLFEIYRHVGTDTVMDHVSRAPAAYRAEDSDTAYIADKFLDFVRLRAREAWFAHVVFLRPHPPLIAPEPYNALVDTADVPAPRRQATLAEEAATHPYLAHWLEEMRAPAYFESQVDVHAITEDDRAALRAVYYGLIAEVDAQVGRIIARLKETGEYDQTLIIFTADHGEMLGDHWCWGKGAWFDAAYHVPLIIRDPRSPAGHGRRIDALTESVDLMPTILEQLGRETPTECNGAALTPWLEGATPDAWRDAVFWEFDFRTVGADQQACGLAPDDCTLNVVRSREHKYVHFTGLPPLFYDLTADPFELENRAGDPDHAAHVMRYAQALLSHRMRHAERSLANTVLSPQGLVSDVRPRPAITLTG